MKQRFLKRIRRFVRSRRFVRYAVLIFNIAILGGIIWFATGTKTSPSVGSSSVVIGNQQSINPLDELSSADIAVNLAVMAGLPETTAVVNQADSVAAELAAPVAQTVVVPKPQAVRTELKSSKDIQKYIVQEGDTLAGIASKFEITSESITWSNGINNGTVSPGATIIIPPVNGIVYTVKQGDTADSLAQKFRASKELIIAANDAELAGLQVNQQILIPNGQQPTPAFTGRKVSAASATTIYKFTYGYNGYDYGFCTWYVANRRAAAGNPIPAGLGNASTWDNRAPSAGLSVGRKPAVGAAAVTSQSGWGHVVYIEKLNEDGSVWASEMNSRGQVSMTDTSSAGGWGKVDWKLFPAEKAHTFSYIY